MPWGNLFQWQITGLMTGPKKKVKHFPKGKTNYLIIITLGIGLILFLSMGLIFKDRIGKIKFQDLPLIKILLPARPTSKSPSLKSIQKEESIAQPETPKFEPRSMTQILEDAELPMELKRLNNLIALDSQNANAFYNRGWIYVYKGEFEKAVEDYTRAININKRHTDAYYNRGLIYVSQSK